MSAPSDRRRSARASAGAVAAVLCGALLAVAVGALLVAPAVAHGGDVPPPPDLASLVLGWSFHPQVVVALLAAAAAYLWAFRRVNVAHPANPVPAGSAAIFLVGLGCIAVALLSGIERYDTELFSDHMVQHLLLVFGAAPALVLGAPITLLLRVVSPATRRGWVLPILRSRVVKVVAHPVVAWLLFTAIMWGSHVSPMFDAALEDPLVHDLEHGLYLASALLFWWPVAGRDPSPYRMAFPARIFYVFLQMPLNSLLGVAILFSEQVLYPHYMTTGRAWPPTPLEDQQLAGAIMWGVGDAGFVVAILVLIAAWMRHEEEDTRRREATEDALAADTAAASISRASTAPASSVREGDGPGQAEGIGASR